MCDYQCTSVSFIKLSNRIESNRIINSPNRNALVVTALRIRDIVLYFVLKKTGSYSSTTSNPRNVPIG